MSKKRTLVFSLLVAAGMLLSTNLSAQEQGRPGGLFGKSSTPSYGMMGRGSGSAEGNLTGQGFGATNGNLTGQGFGATDGNITGQTFGTPLGSGLFIMFAAGVGYATLKTKKKQKQN